MFSLPWLESVTVSRQCQRNDQTDLQMCKDEHYISTLVFETKSAVGFGKYHFTNGEKMLVASFDFDIRI